MNDACSQDPDGQLQLIRDVLEDNGTIDGDVLQIARGTWAIHGTIPVDGEVLMGEFGTKEQAQRALDQLRGDMRRSIGY